MTDFIAKARANRVIALKLHKSGTVMFFPDDIPEVGTSRKVTHISKPMFVRSQSLRDAAIVATPAKEAVANLADEPLVLGREHAA
ncbi:hypothetical protein [Celeribacter sp.]|uniref:hypothetical protein n=1 Tax=Celeribacter sp. TaxID=1890673 RepID=UPI003A8E1A03